MRSLCAVLLAAGEGRRLRPLTESVPKALCPVGNIALLDRALDAVGRLGLTGSGLSGPDDSPGLSGPDDVAVNAWHLADAIIAHVGGDRPRAHVSVEIGPRPLGSAGGLAALRDWIDGRDVLVGNADAYLAGGDLGVLLSDPDSTVRMLGVPAGDRAPEFGTSRFAGFSLIPWRYIAGLRAEPTDLVREVWRPAEAAGRLRVVDYGGTYLDCGTPTDYLAANLHAASLAGGRLVAPDALVSAPVTGSVIGPGAIVRGRVERSVVWPRAVVEAGEQLSDAIRYGRSATIHVRGSEGQPDRPTRPIASA